MSTTETILQKRGVLPPEEQGRVLPYIERLAGRPARTPAGAEVQAFRRQGKGLG